MQEVAFRRGLVVEPPARTAIPPVQWFSRASDIDTAVWDLCFPHGVENLWWYQTLDSSRLDTQFSFKYLLLADDDGPLAIAPAFAMNVPIRVLVPDEVEPILKVLDVVAPFVTTIKTLFIGSPCAEQGTIGMREGADRGDVFDRVMSAAKALAARIGCQMLTWKDFDEADSACLSSVLKQHSFRVCSFPGTEVDLPRGNFGTFLASLNSGRRYTLKKKLRKSEAAINLSSDVVSGLDEQTLSEVYALYLQTYNHGKTKFERLTKEFFRLIDQEPTAEYLLLRDSEQKLVAFMLLFAVENRLINKFIGLDYSRDPECYLFYRLTCEAIKYALSRQFSIFQSGQTGYSGKFATGHRLVPLYNFVHHRNPIVHKILVLIAKTINWHSIDDDLTKYLDAHPEALPPS